MVKIIQMVVSMAFGKRLASIRKSRGLTQEGLAGLVGLAKLQIYRYERGSSQPTLEVLKKIAQALSVSIDVLVFDDNERNPDNELLLLFEGVSRLEPDEKKMVKTLLEGLLIKHQTKQMVNNLSS